jgi:signal transduction histidine kinase
MRLATFRLTLLATPLYLLAGLAVLAFVYVNTLAIMDRRIDHGIEAERQRLQQDLRQAQDDEVMRMMAARIVAERGSRRLYLLRGRDGVPLVSNFEVTADELPQPGKFAKAKVLRAPGDTPTPARLHAFALAGLTLVIGRDLAEETDFRLVVEETLTIAVVLTGLLAAVVGVVVSRAVLRRLAQVNRTARRILRGRLEERVPLAGNDDEFDHLAANLNDMLDRIVDLMRATREVTDNVAHDLRSPLSRMRNRLELALLPGNGRDALEQAVRASLDDTDRVLETFEALLGIARMEHGLAPDFREVDLAVLAEDCVDYFLPLAEEKGVTLTLDNAQRGRVAADPHLLFQAVSNVLDNAIRYTPSGGHIRVTVQESAGFAVLSVADDGPGIPADRRADVLRRFVRLDTSRHHPGSGLGLAVVEAVARHHRGRLELADNHPGLVVSLALALAHESAAS